MRGDTVTDCSPVVRTERLDLARVVDIDGLGRRGLVAFEHEVAWLRQIGARVVVSHGGRVVDECGSFCDAWRWGSSVEAAIEKATDLCEFWSVGRESSMTVSVLATATETPVLLPGTKSLFGQIEYRAVPKAWMRHEPARIEACLLADGGIGADRPEGGWPLLLAEVVADDVPVWTSSASDAENQASVSGFIDRWVAGP
jgi:hypothetical protein